MSDLLKAIARSYMNPTQEVRTLAAPAVGTDLKIPATNGQDWRVLGVTATLTTSAAVANRTVRAFVDDQTNVAMSLPTGVTQAASLAVVYSWVAGLSFSPATATAGFVALTLPDLILPTGWQFRTATGLIDVGDQWSAVTIYIERTDEPPWLSTMIGTEADEELQHDLEAMRQEAQ